MNILQVQNIAQQYALTIKHPETGFIFDVTNPKEFHSCFYFDLIVKNIANDNDPVPVGGPAGIIISKKDMQAEVISFGNLSSLEKNEESLEMLYELLTGTDPINEQLSVFKNKFKIGSEQFMQLHHDVLQNKNEKELILNMIQSLLDRQAQHLHVN